MKRDIPQRRYWLIKSEGDCYSIDDLKRDKKTGWSGIRNYQARNFMRDDMHVGDLVLFYHSTSEPTGIYGVAKVASQPRLDQTSVDSKDEHFDPSAVKREKEIVEGKRPKHDHLWIMVDMQFVKKFDKPISLQEMKIDSFLEGMPVLKRGMRLSVQPVSEKHFNHIQKIASAD
ncbi:MAG: EVE domain-containing protein [Patescibacteria group bacterium]